MANSAWLRSIISQSIMKMFPKVMILAMSLKCLRFFLYSFSNFSMPIFWLDS